MLHNFIALKTTDKQYNHALQHQLMGKMKNHIYIEVMLKL